MSAVSCHKPDRLVLALCGSEERLQIVLGEPGPNGYSVLAARQWHAPRQSLKVLVPGIKAALDGFGVTTDALAKIACVRGPGSFTGLRVVLAAAQGIAAGHDLPLAGVDYLPLLASGPASLVTGPLHVLTYARRGLVYSQSFEAPTLVETAPLMSFTLKDAAARMAELGNTATLMGSGLRKNPDFFAELAAANTGYTLLDAQWDTPSPDTLLAAGIQAVASADSMDPVYVRPTDAEDNLPQIAKKRGLDPEAAKKRLDKLRNQ
ncbi:tRNA (adenosine(37)-N6)-threonylcarbamoyltransferase complex dimerization subunit type 1 TsaB [Pseudodesulfovibrio sediminis]|uniref:tRNA (Adenosine(37)-N6)-threonylcarbamoyltransferase complex dimerization subunit type 1 TsaB n=1 Tax=Pseudodesulfovibrio sediminis TaxID=2810563 RepID=A0ABN6EL65_9BACT|nr:tRNA (adenosine(37)-N6)-threonylcarbamoyltransferase complex dimerization subunit type 1 TsaB [Pseudodesulfovibrio sediminis]BCS86761.1 tRNA (adenosine(37)-N6)-threonylcarbamoyltransferase complex dimerization subunit type 1 TsaB [Pseudodesulfovibrio sediminis]